MPLNRKLGESILLNRDNPAEKSIKNLTELVKEIYKDGDVISFSIKIRETDLWKFKAGETIGTKTILGDNLSKQDEIAIDTVISQILKAITSKHASK